MRSILVVFRLIHYRLCATPRDMPMQANRGGGELQPVRNFALEEGRWSVPRYSRFTLGQSPSPI